MGLSSQYLAMISVHLLFVLLLVLVIHLGYAIAWVKNRHLARSLAWTLAVLSGILAHWMTHAESPLFRMIALVCFSLTALKSSVMVETYKGQVKLNYLQWSAFVSWFGMRPIPFEAFPSKPLSGALSLFFKGCTRLTAGLILLYLAKYLLSLSSIHYLIPFFISLIGLSLALHFGVLNISTAFWRLSGVDCKELFRSPLLSKSLKEFWGRRWNLAFSEMTAIVLYKPVKNTYGTLAGILMAFLFSGILHEMAISAPVQSGFGFPLLYFCLHGVLQLAENRVVWVKRLLSHLILSRCWVIGWLLLPLPLLFNRAFVNEVVFPFVKLLPF